MASARSTAKKASTPAPAPPQVTSSSVQPAASTSQQPAPSINAVTKSPDRQPSPDMDVDVGGTPEPEGVANQPTRDSDSDEIVRQLERGLPRWEGFSDQGWMEEVSQVSHHLLALFLQRRR